MSINTGLDVDTDRERLGHVAVFHSPIQSRTFADGRIASVVDLWSGQITVVALSLLDVSWCYWGVDFLMVKIQPKIHQIF